MASNGGPRATTAFMRQLTKMFEEVPEIIWEQGAIIIPDPARLEKILPRYYKTSKFSSFQRQLNNFGYHRSYAANERLDRSKSRGVCYHKVAGVKLTEIRDLLTLRPLVRRKKREASGSDGDEPPPRRPMTHRTNLGSPRYQKFEMLLDARFQSSATSSADDDDVDMSLSPCEDDALSVAEAAHCLVSMNEIAHCLLIVNQRTRMWV
ncbi:hypothetical protein M885DRAFT_550220 [Pelagophyceae sp. CCMP2097]|nr:hypothetical protein M885DRAFT_550220 [Pelagophyceae sp. CCMP2097]